jgi:hypothetical protein
MSLRRTLLRFLGQLAGTHPNHWLDFVGRDTRLSELDRGSGQDHHRSGLAGARGVAAFRAAVGAYRDRPAGTFMVGVMICNDPASVMRFAASR